jgi:dTDP-glucose 4,6-dehydratase
MPCLASPCSSSLFEEDLELIESHTRNFWEEVRGERLFLTGGTGFFGTWLVESFLWIRERLELDAELVVLSRDPEAICRKRPSWGAHAALDFHRGDVRTFAFPPGRFSHVIHAVNQTAEDSSPRRMLDLMADGTRHVLEFALECGAGKLLFTSSGSVYGSPLAAESAPPAAAFAEDFAGVHDAADPACAHGRSRLTAERLCADYARQYGFEAKIARGFAFVGPYLPLDANYAVGNFIRDGLRGGPIVVRGDGRPLRSYLYAADLAIWLWAILFHGRSCRPYNVGSDRAMTIAEVANRVADAFAARPEVRILSEPTAGAARACYVPNVDRARTELNLKQSVDLETSIRRTVSWCRREASCRQVFPFSKDFCDG